MQTQVAICQRINTPKRLSKQDLQYIIKSLWKGQRQRKISMKESDVNGDSGTPLFI